MAGPDGPQSDSGQSDGDISGASESAGQTLLSLLRGGQDQAGPEEEPEEPVRCAGSLHSLHPGDSAREAAGAQRAGLLPHGPVSDLAGDSPPDLPAGHGGGARGCEELRHQEHGQDERPEESAALSLPQPPLVFLLQPAPDCQVHSGPGGPQSSHLPGAR